MPPKPLSYFKYQGIELQKPPEKEEQCQTDLETTAWIVDQLRRSSWNSVRRIIDANPAVRRLWIPKELRGGATTGAAPWKLDSQAHATSLAAFIFTERPASLETCQQCASPHSSGPAINCHAPGLGLLNGACTNCFYSGTGHLCSFRQDIFEAEQKKLTQEEYNEYPGFKMAMGQDMSQQELRDQLQLVENEIAARAEAEDEGKKTRRKSPAKRQRR